MLQTYLYLNGSKYTIKDKMSLTPISSVDEAHKMALEAKMLLSGPSNICQGPSAPKRPYRNIDKQVKNKKTRPMNNDAMTSNHEAIRTVRHAPNTTTSNNSC